MKYIRTKNGMIFEIVDYEQLDDKTKECLKQKRFVGLSDYINDEIFVKVHKQMPKPFSQYQSIKMFDILKQADTIEELCDKFICLENGMMFGDLEVITSSSNLKDLTIYGAIWTDWGLKFVAKWNGERGELELL